MEPISYKLISLFLCFVFLSETRGVISGSSISQRRHSNSKYKDPPSNTTPNLNEVTKWSNESPLTYDSDSDKTSDDAFLQQQQEEDYYGEDYGRKDVDGKLSQVLLLLADLSGEVHGLRNQIGNLKFQNHMVYKQLKRLQSRCISKTGENDVIASAAHRLEEPVCPKDYMWNRRTSSCYRFGTDRVTWRMARERCRAQGADLVTIESEAEQRFLTEKAAKSHDTKHCDFWTGATDRAKEGQWRWVHNGHSLSYTNWKPNEPNNGSTDEHCMYLMWVFRWKWNDGRCNFENVCYICEIQIME